MGQSTITLTHSGLWQTANRTPVVTFCIRMLAFHGDKPAASKVAVCCRRSLQDSVPNSSDKSETGNTKRKHSVDPAVFSTSSSSIFFCHPPPPPPPPTHPPAPTYHVSEGRGAGWRFKQVSHCPSSLLVGLLQV